MPDLPFPPDHLLSLVRALTHSRDAGIGFTIDILICQSLEHRVLLELAYLPIVEVLHIGHHVDLAAGSQQIRIVGQ